KPAFTQAENDERTSIETELKTNMEETALSMIIGKKSLSEWDKFVEIQDKMNWKRLEELYNEAWKRK
ncbi:MAG: hypothetical protein KAQ69_12275, partial [Spirochaetales bacterium]|nr:hypothetical protein [Spirochaetales bacterium]